MQAETPIASRTGQVHRRWPGCALAWPRMDSRAAACRATPNPLSDRNPHPGGRRTVAKTANCAPSADPGANQRETGTERAPKPGQASALTLRLEAHDYMVGRDGIEPSTNGLKVHCSTAELTAPLLSNTASRVAQLSLPLSRLRERARGEGHAAKEPQRSPARSLPLSRSRG